MRLVCYHLLNDYSGSPKVLMGTIRKALADGHEVHLFTSRGGPLDSISHPKFRRYNIPYSFSKSPLITGIKFLIAQILSFFSAFRYIFSSDTYFYTNTILPAGAAIGAALIGKKLTVHCHENALAKGRIYRCLNFIMLNLADEIVCVSRYQASQLSHKQKINIVPNTLTPEFRNSLHPDTETAYSRRNILMLTSLKIYKGVREFFNLAALMPEFRFTLVVSDTQQAIDKWLHRNGISPTGNISLYPCQKDVSQFYNDASIVISLTNPRLVVESFGMTILEARACRLPVIVPEIGGIAELITENYNGFHIDCHDTPKLTSTIRQLLTDYELYKRIATADFD